MDDDFKQVLELLPLDTAPQIATAVFTCAGMLVTCSLHVDTSNTRGEVAQMGGVVSVGIPRLGMLHASLQPSPLPCSDIPVLRFMACTFPHEDMLATCGMYLDASSTSEQVTEMGGVVVVGIPRLGTLHVSLQ
jgi:uncharacterized membrane protein